LIALVVSVTFFILSFSLRIQIKDIQLASRARVAYQASPPRVPSVPHFPHLKENNVRQGFITPEQFAQLVAHCPDLWLRAMLETAYNYG
jgi:hypothetical protein